MFHIWCRPAARCKMNEWEKKGGDRLRAPFQRSELQIAWWMLMDMFLVLQKLHIWEGSSFLMHTRIHRNYTPNFCNLLFSASDSMQLEITKKPRVRKIFCTQFWGRKWLREFYGRLECLRSFCRNTSMPINFLLLGGRVYWVLGGGGGSADFIFMGAGIFWTKAKNQMNCQDMVSSRSHDCSKLGLTWYLVPLSPSPLPASLVCRWCAISQ